MQLTRTYLLVVIMGLFPIAVYATTIQDSIPPIFTTLPSDSTIVCHTDVTAAFQDWLSNQANAVADFGEATIVPTLSPTNALDSLQSVISLGCSGTGTVAVGFIATDSCGNQSLDTPIANFIIIDNTSPSFVPEASGLDIECTASAVESLQIWIDNKGGASLTDNCSTDLAWTTYTWEDNLGNTGFSTFEDSTNIEILRESCLWSVDVTFFAQDECGNTNATSATFSITGDTELPSIIFTPADTTLLCNQVLMNAEPVIVDGCDGPLSLTVSDSTTQSLDTLSCAHYNYELHRRWTAIDICGNQVQTSQVISYTDTLSPQLTFEQTVAVNCDVDLNTASNFISATDDCSVTTISFQDSTLFSSNCQNQISRSWAVNDVCGNVDTVTQIIQVQDFSGPEFLSFPRDTIIFCDSNNPEAIFSNWLSNIGGGTVSDNCTEFFTKGLPPSVYTDTTEIKTTDPPTLILQDCTNTFGALSTQGVSFVAYDVCGNITQREALFSIIDNQVPLVSNCPSDFELRTTDNSCSADVQLTLPSFTDNCLTIEDAQWEIKNNDIVISNTNQPSLNISLEIGENSLDYTITDCGGNKASCNQTIVVTDNSPPSFICPEDQTIYLGRNQCEINYLSEEVSSFEENCPAASAYSQVLPGEDALLEFTFNSVVQLFQASDFFMDFSDVTFDNILSKPQLKITYALELDSTSEIEIKDENNSVIQTISSSSCSAQAITVDLSEASFEAWAADETVRFSVVTKANGGSGILPCDPDNVSGFQGNDGISFLRVELTYGDLTTTKELTDLQTGVTQALPTEIELTPGSYLIEYTANDSSQNQSSCTTSIIIQDTIPPRLLCDDVTYTIDPLLEDFYPILESDLLFIESDNCGIETLEFRPREISCSDQNTSVVYTISTTDIYGNSSSCESNIAVEPAALEPSFLSGLCFADTLKLISNLPDNLGFVIEWEGPNQFRSTVNNPIISGITGDSSGEYILRATSPAGCIFEGRVDIDVNEFDSPEIFSNLTEICDGEELLLNTNSFTEIVDYLWYEGISPNGTLIGQTTGPSFTLRPIVGDHFYYVEVKGNECNSNPSNTLTIQVTPPPQAQILNPFVELCEGDDLTLLPSSNNPNFTYTWSGPNNFLYVGADPPIIANVTQANEGTYTLVINQQDCISNIASAQVFVTQNPILPIITGESIFCEGQSAVLTVPNLTGGTRYKWYLNGVLFSTVTSNSLLIPAISNNQSGAWTVIVEDGICSSEESASFPVNVETSLNIGATNDGPHCEGDEVLLTCSFIPGATYRWTDPNGASYDGRIVTAPAIEGVYTVTVTTTSNCQAITNTTLVVGQRPTITALSNTSLPCMSGDMSIRLVPTVFPPGNYEYQWSGPNNFSSNQEEPIIPNASESDNGVYVLRVIQNNCESMPSTTTIDITDEPESAMLTANQDPCLGDELTIFISNPVQGNDAAWIWTTPVGIIETAIPQLTISVFTENDNGAYTVVQENNDCRSVDSGAILINIQSEPVKPVIQATQNLCIGESVTLTIDEEGADQYIWFTPNGTMFLTEPRLVIDGLSQADAGAYSVFLLEGNCTSDTSDAYFLEVLSLPESVSFAEREIELCSDDLEELILCIEEANADFEKIIVEDINSSVILQESTSECLDLSFLLGTNAEYELNLYAETNGCRSSNSDLITLIINDSPSTGATVATNTYYACEGDFISLSIDDLPSDIDILWTATNPNINIFDEQEQTASISNLNVGENTILLQSTNGACKNYFTDSIEVIRLTELEAENDSYDLAYDENIILMPLLNDSYAGEVSIALMTEPDNGTISIEGSILNFEPPLGFIGTEEFTYELCYTECPGLCATATIQLTIGENVNCFVGNVITPNNDGYNDALTVPCLQTGNYPLNSIVVFNQWGDEIFSNSPYDNNWAGTYDGTKLPASTYFYILDLGDGSKPIQGYIVLEY